MPAYLFSSASHETSKSTRPFIKTGPPWTHGPFPISFQSAGMPLEVKTGDAGRGETEITWFPSGSSNWMSPISIVWGAANSLLKTATLDSMPNWTPGLLGFHFSGSKSSTISCPSSIGEVMPCVSMPPFDGYNATTQLNMRDGVRNLKRSLFAAVALVKSAYLVNMTP